MKMSAFTLRVAAVVIASTGVMTQAYSTENFEDDSYLCKTSAPFTVEEVIKCAQASPPQYNLPYLDSSEGQNAIQKVIDQINTSGIPPKTYSVHDAWNRGNPRAFYNWSLIADFVSREYNKSKK